MDLEKKLLSIQELSKSLLSKILGLNVNPKYLILEQAIIKPLEKICGVKWLRSNGVEKIFKLEEKAPDFGSKTVYYMIYANFSVFKRALDQIRAVVDIENPKVNKFHIVIVPEVTYIFEKELEEEGLLHSSVRLHSFQWLPIHIDEGVLSLEFPFSFKSIFVDGSLTHLSMFSKCLWQLSLVIGNINFILALGQHSKAILSQYNTLCENLGKNDRSDADISGLILFDRSLDYPSTLLTPGIYSALLKEVYTVTAGHCESKVVENTSTVDNLFIPVIEKDPVVIHLDSESDSVYATTKNKYFTEVTSVLSNLTKELRKEKLDSKDMSIEEIKKYVRTQLRPTNSRKKLISNHLIAAETIIKCLGYIFENLCETESNIINNLTRNSNFNFLIELTSIENDAVVSLRLFCLMLMTQGLSESEIDMFWEKFLHQFGFHHLYIIQNLTNAGILTNFNHINTGKKLSTMKLPKFSTSQFYSTANRLRQIPTDKERVNYKDPKCPSYVFRGTYIPMITQIVNMLLDSIPLDEIHSKLDNVTDLIIENKRAYPLESKTLLVCVIGGVTYAEIGAINLIEKLTEAKVIVLSDKIISGNDIVNSFFENSN